MQLSSTTSENPVIAVKNFISFSNFFNYILDFLALWLIILFSVRLFRVIFTKLCFIYMCVDASRATNSCKKKIERIYIFENANQDTVLFQFLGYRGPSLIMLHQDFFSVLQGFYLFPSQDMIQLHHVSSKKTKSQPS